tara:strand:+ start:350 stop:553 length:204 start_codon:yes stop_codon:yes gene_type:complete
MKTAALTLYTVTTLPTSLAPDWTETYDITVIDRKGDLGSRALANRIEKEHGWRPDSIVRVQRAVYAS